MSIEQYKLAWERDIPKGEKIILLRLADFADPDGNRVYPSVGRIAHDTGFSERHVKRIMKAWREAGVLTNCGWSEYGTRRYKLDMNKLPTRRKYDMPVSKWNHSEKAKRNDVGVKVGEGVTLEAEGVTLEAIRGDTHVTLPVSNNHQSLSVRDNGNQENENLQGMKNGNGKVDAVTPAEIHDESALSNTVDPGAASLSNKRVSGCRNGMTQKEWDALPKWRKNEIERDRNDKLERI